MLPRTPAALPALAWCLLSGVLLALSFPLPHAGWLALVALAPWWLVVVQEKRRLRAFLCGYLVGAMFFGGTCYWVFYTMRVYGKLSAAAAAGALALLMLYLGLFFGVFSWALAELARRGQLRALALAPFLWVAVEWLRGSFFFLDFPWNLLGYAVAPYTGLIQVAAATGVWGVSFLLAGVNALVAATLLEPGRRRLAALGAVAIALAAALASGALLGQVPTSAETLLVQTNLPQQEEFDPLWTQHHPDELAALEQLTLTALGERKRPGPVLVIWPEVPVSFYFHHDAVVRARLTSLAQAGASHLIVSVVDYEIAEGRAYNPRNSAVLLAPDGRFVSQYDKIHLVPFGEYVPARRWLQFAEPLVGEVSDFTPGREVTVMAAGGDRLAVLICYEAVFPALVRQFVDRGATVLVNISNDGWYGRTAAPVQLLNMARLRAVENRRFLLRATNNGVTAVIDPYGRITAEAPVDARTVLAARYASRAELTLYARFGDWFPALCALLALATLGRALWERAVERAAEE